MMNPKKRKVITSVLAVMLIIVMIVPMVLGFLI